MASAHPEDDPAVIPSAVPARRRRSLLFGLLVGIFGAAVVVLIGWFISSALSRPPELTRAAYEAASKRWDANGPASYDLDVELGGKRPGLVHVEVRNGEATRMTRDGVEPKQERTWYYWTVPGQFDTIEQELEMAQDPARNYAVPGASQAVLWAEFDPKYGYPLRFDRVVLGADVEVHWKVTRFEPVDSKK